MNLLKTHVLYSILFLGLITTLLVVKFQEEDYFPQKVGKPAKSKFWQWWKQSKKLPKKVSINKPLPTVIKSDSGDCIMSNFEHSWRDFDGKEYEMTWEICQKDYLDAQRFRSKTHSYVEMVEHDIPAMMPLVEQYQNLIVENNLNRFEALNMVVTSMQDIEYTLVHTNSHLLSNFQSAYYLEYHQQHRDIHPLEQVGGCLANVEPMACVSPVEVAYHQMADCDSRTTFLFLILRKLGYDVIVLSGPSSVNSYHSILAINILEGNGQHYDYLGKRYYLFETTYYPAHIGVFNPSIPYDERQWDVYLY
jgi:hypothetical protein